MALCPPTVVKAIQTAQSGAQKLTPRVTGSLAWNWFRAFTEDLGILAVVPAAHQTNLHRTKAFLQLHFCRHLASCVSVCNVLIGDRYLAYSGSEGLLHSAKCWSCFLNLV